MKRVLSGGIVAALLLIPSAASAHVPDVDIGCHDGVPIVRTEMAKYDPAGANRIRLYIDGDLRFDRQFPAAFRSTSILGSGYVSHHVRVIVKAWDDVDGSLGYSRTFRLFAPACKGREHVVSARASIADWCADPMTRYTLQPGDHTTTFTITRTDAGHTVTLTKRVGHDRTYVTGWKHVDQFTTTTVRANGRLLASRTAPKGGWYGRCS